MGLIKKISRNKKKKVDERVKNTKPSLPLIAYKGVYNNKMLRNATVNQIGDTLEVNFNSHISYRASHWHFDTFITNKDPSSGEKFEIRFDLNNNGEVKQLDFMGAIFTKKE